MSSAEPTLRDEAAVLRKLIEAECGAALTPATLAGIRRSLDKARTNGMRHAAEILTGRFENYPKDGEVEITTYGGERYVFFNPRTGLLREGSPVRSVLDVTDKSE